MQVLTQAPAISVASQGVIGSRQFSISSEQMAKGAQILGEMLYNDRATAVIREYSTNAADAHLMNGQKDRPIHVTLPSSLSPIFKVRDFGPGITEDQIFNVYTAYFASTKENEADANGFLGLGSKAGFAYADTFTVVSVVDAESILKAILHLEDVVIPNLRAGNAGVQKIEEQQETLRSLYAASEKLDGTSLRWKSVYTAYKNDMLIPCMDKQYEEPTEEETGIEVWIPLDESRDRNAITIFNSRALTFYRHFTPTPIFTGSSIQSQIEAYQNRKPLYQGVTPEGVEWGVYDTQSYSSGGSLAVMGNVPYPIDQELWSWSREKLNYNLVGDGNLILKFPTGAVINNPSRESLDRSPRTVKSLKRAIKRIMIAVRKQGRAELAESKTLWESRVSFSRYSSMDAYLRNIILPKPLFNNRSISPHITEDVLKKVLNASLGLPEETSNLNALFERGLLDFEGTSAELDQIEEGEKKRLQRNAGEILSLRRATIQQRYYSRLNQYGEKRMPSFDSVGNLTPSGNLVLIVGVTHEHSPARLNNFIRAAMRQGAVEHHATQGACFLFPNRESLERFLAHKEIEGATHIDLATVTPWFLPQDSRGVSEEMRTKQKSKVFVYEVDKDWHPDSRSKMWSPLEIDAEEGEGYYIRIDQYEPSRSERGPYKWLAGSYFGPGRGNGNDALNDLIRQMRALDIEVPQIVGIREQQFEKLALGEGWKPFSTFVKETLVAIMLGSAQQRVDHDRAAVIDGFYHSLIPVVEELPEGKFKSFVALLKEKTLDKGHVAFRTDMATRLLNGSFLGDTEPDPSVDFEKIEAELLEHYPLLGNLVASIGAYNMLIPTLDVSMPEWRPIKKPIPPMPLRGEYTPAQEESYKKQKRNYEIEKGSYDWKCRRHKDLVATFREQKFLYEVNLKRAIETRENLVRYLKGFPG